MRSKIAGIGKYLPEQIVKNADLEGLMETSDAWIQERTGIQERRFAKKGEESVSSMGAAAAKIAIERAGIDKEDVDFIIFATLSPDYYFPGCGVLVQRELGITKTEIGALDIRNQCSGFIYAISTADQYIRSGMYKNILVIGAEFHSMGLDFTTKGRNVSVIFGDGAGAVLMQPTTVEGQGLLSSKLHSDGTYAEKLAFLTPGSHGGYHQKDDENGVDYGFKYDSFENIFINQTILDNDIHYPQMDGQFVFKMAVQKFPEVIMETLAEANLKPTDLTLLVPHQANLRIASFVGKTLGLKPNQVFNNIQKYGNTTAASIPIALCEAWEAGMIKAGDLISLAAFGSGFTWGASLIRW